MEMRLSKTKARVGALAALLLVVVALPYAGWRYFRPGS
jgi:hypothetical protein